MIPLNLLIQGGIGIASSIIGSRKRQREQSQAQSEYDRAMARYKSQDLSNPFENMENTLEDLTVNRQAADFQAAQQAQGMANTMDALRGAAGGSGIAALAQSLANQQAANAQAASADIARQEASNQAAAARMAGQIQSQERQGEMISRNLQREQFSTELGMGQQRLAAANMARQEATQQLLGGIGNLTGGGIAARENMASNEAKNVFQSLLL
tara:strand:- start:2903 stop:3538 length:636 start_codon:yes stop_codon:yes gene_type:complete